MEKINAGKTLLAMAKSLSNETTAKETPFILAVKNAEEDKKGVSCAVVTDTHTAIELTAAVIDGFAQCMKSSNAPTNIVFDLLSSMMLHAVKENYGDREIEEGLNVLVGNKLANMFGEDEEEGEDE